MEKEGSLSLILPLLYLRLELQVHLGWLTEGNSLLFLERGLLSAPDLTPHVKLPQVL